MSWGNLKTWLAGELITAAMMNEQIRDKLATLWVYQIKGDLAVASGASDLARLAAGANGQVLSADSAQIAGLRWLSLHHGTLPGLSDNSHPQYILHALADAKGDLLAASGPDAMARLAAGVDGQVLTADSAQIAGLRWGAGGPLLGFLQFAGNQVTTSTVYTDISGATLNLTLTRPSTILLLAVGTFRCTTAGFQTHVRGVIDGTGDADKTYLSGFTADDLGWRPFSVLYQKTAVAAGVRTIKLQFRSSDPGNTATIGAGGGTILAIAFPEG